jgi:hypothetical protein
MVSFNEYKKNNQTGTNNYSLRDIKHLDPNIKLLDCETDGLLDFEVQTTLETFQKFKKN